MTRDEELELIQIRKAKLVLSEGLTKKPIEPEAALEESLGDYALETVKNIPSSAIQYGKDLVEPFLSPIESAKGVYNLGKGVYNKFTPGVQPSEANVDAVGAYLKDRYVDNLSNTVKTDPVGILGDAAGLASGGLGLASKGAKLANLGGAADKLDKLSGTASLVDPLSATINAAKTAKAKMINRDKAIDQIIDNMNLYTDTKDGLRGFNVSEDRANTIAKYKAYPTLEGMKNVDKALKSRSSELEDLLVGSTDNLSTQGVDALLEEARVNPDYVGLGSTSPIKSSKQINNIRKEWEARGEDPFMSPIEMNKLKQKAQSDAKNFYGKRKSQTSTKGLLLKDIAAELRDEVSSVSPEVNKINSELQDLIDIKNPVSKGFKRMRNNEGGPSFRQMMFAAGANILSPSLSVPAMTYMYLNTPQKKVTRAIDKISDADKLSLMGDPRVKTAVASALLRSGEDEESTRGLMD